MGDILVKIEEKRGYYSITYFKAITKTEYAKNKRVLGYYTIQRDEIKDPQDFIRRIKHFYIECLSGKELVFVK